MRVVLESLEKLHVQAGQGQAGSLSVTAERMGKTAAGEAQVCRSSWWCFSQLLVRSEIGNDTTTLYCDLCVLTEDYLPCN